MTGNTITLREAYIGALREQVRDMDRLHDAELELAKYAQGSAKFTVREKVISRIRTRMAVRASRIETYHRQLAGGAQ